MRRYSRLLSVEERRHRRKAFIYGLLSLLILFAFLFYGLPTIASLSAILGDFRPKSVDETDKKPPAKPRFLTQSVATNNATLILSGIDQAGVEVALFQNGKDLGIVKTTDTGSFEKLVKLTEGNNKFTARAKNDKGVESQNSDTLEIILDTSPPEIIITEPTGKNFTEEKITIKGEVDEDAEVSVNDKIVVLDEQNSFSASVTLKSGENNIVIKAVDKASNEATLELSLVRS